MQSSEEHTGKQFMADVFSNNGETDRGKILLTGGGSAGHVTPNMALIPKLQALQFDVHYIGRNTGVERDLIAPLGVSYHAISAGKLRRYLDLKNLTDAFRVGWGFSQAFALVHTLRPQVVFSKGGFVSCPVVWAAWLHRIPAIIHESDLTPGLANKLSAPFATRICYSFPETAAYVSAPKGVHTGIPIRDALHSGNFQEGRTICKFPDQKPVILITGGSLGAAAINDAVRGALPRLREQFNICHLCGAGHIDSNLKEVTGYTQFEYVNEELPHLFALADVVVSRAGATTLFELLALHKPHLLIPLPLTSSRGDQVLNARSFEKQGLSLVLPEEHLTSETLMTEIQRTYTRRAALIQGMQAAESVNGVDRVMELILQYGRSR